MAGLCAALVLPGCSMLGIGGDDKGVPGVVGSVRGFLGGAASDDPRAAIAARDILSAGGSAADAAVAAAFSLAVSYPVQVPLGGGGVCLVSVGTKRTRVVETVSFPAIAARPQSRVATPGLPRGLFALQARFGKLRWEQVMAPAENLARAPTPVSRALAIDLARYWPVAAADPGLSAMFGRAGQPLAEGQPLVQPQLAAVLGAIRQRGPGDLHNGALAAQIVAAASAAGLDLTMADLAAGIPQLGAAYRVGEEVEFYVATLPAEGSLATGQIYGALEKRWKATPAAERTALLLSTAAAASRDRAQWVGADLSATAPLGETMAPARLKGLAGGGGDWALPDDTQLGASLAVVDRNGMAVACSFTGMQPFGLGRVVPGIGFLLAPAVDNKTASTRWLTAAMAVRDRSHLVFAGGAAGGPGAPLALAQTALAVINDGMALDRAIDLARAAPLADGRIAVDGLGVVPGLAARGYRAVELPGAVARVQAVWCKAGLSEEPETCQIETDRRGAGLGFGSQ